MNRDLIINFLVKLTMVTCCVFYASGYEIHGVLMQVALLLSIIHLTFEHINLENIDIFNIASIGVDLAILSVTLLYTASNSITLEVAFILAILITLKAFVIWIDVSATMKKANQNLAV